jgi:hypothetical protein
MSASAATLRPDARPSARAVFELRCWARARLYAEGEYSLHEAVDHLQADAEASGLVAAIGQDEVQRILGEAFAAVRPELEVADVIPDALPETDSTNVARSTLDAAEYLVRENDPKRFETWLLKHSAAERAAIVAHINKRGRS